MKDLRIAAAQFEHRDGEPSSNLDRIAALTRRAEDQGAELICFHECAISGYTFLQRLDRSELQRHAEPVPDGPSCRALQEIARDHGLVVSAGLLEIDPDGRLFNAYVVMGPDGPLARHRKLHPFINPAIEPGESYTLFDLNGIRIGVLTCYDNNLPENARATTLLGAEVILAPHVTGGTPSVMPGRGPVARELWENRERDPVRLRQEFEGPKGLGWLMRWLPARAWENGVGYVFTNAVGVDGDTIKPGQALILDPHGEVLTRCSALGDDVTVGLLTAEAYEQASGRRYLNARRPELYGPITAPRADGEPPVTKPGWALAFDAEAERV